MWLVTKLLTIDPLLRLFCVFIKVFIFISYNKSLNPTTVPLFPQNSSQNILTASCSRWLLTSHSIFLTTIILFIFLIPSSPFPTPSQILSTIDIKYLYLVILRNQGIRPIYTCYLTLPRTTLPFHLFPAEVSLYLNYSYPHLSHTKRPSPTPSSSSSDYRVSTTEPGIRDLVPVHCSPVHA